MTSGAGPERVRVTHPRTDAARRTAHRPTREIEEQTALGAVYTGTLIRTQRRLALTVCAVIGTLLVVTALAGALVPAYGRVRAFGIPAPWLVLGLFVYPVLIALGWLAVRAAERNEQDFTDLVRRR